MAWCATSAVENKDEADLQYEQRLLRDALDLHERDRKLVAFEIHDGLAQQLTGGALQIPGGRADACDATRKRQAKLFDEAVGLLGKAMAECRRLISGLRPPVLDEAGSWPPSIRWSSSNRTSTAAWKSSSFITCSSTGWRRPLEIAAFRIVQECLTNACRHSKSRQVRIELRQTDGRVRDRACRTGASASIPHRVASGHFGLEGIRERARLLDGAVAIESAPGQGLASPSSCRCSRRPTTQQPAMKRAAAMATDSRSS